MKLRNALRILMDNFSNTYKFLLYRVVTGALFFGLIYAVLNIGLHAILTSPEIKEIIELIGKFFESLVSGRTSYLETFRDTFLEACRAFIALLGENVGSIVGSILMICLLYLISRFLNGVALFAIGSIFNDKMSLYTKTSFSAAYFKNLGRAMLYHVIYVPVSFVYDLLVIAFCWFFFFFTPSLMSGWSIASVLVGLSVSIAAFLCLQALKMTIVSAWIPATIAEENGVIGGLKTCLKGLGKDFGGRFSNFLLTVYTIFILNIVCGLCTLGSALLIAIPASYLFLLCLQFVCYYNDQNKKYYISFRTIEGDDLPDGMGE